MDLVMGAMGVLPAKVLELLKEEYNLQTGVQNQIKNLSAELEVICTSLAVVAKVPPDKVDPQTKLWRRDVQEASYDMEDILDDFLVRVDGGPQQPSAGPDRVHQQRPLMTKIKKSFGFSTVVARHEIATEIVDIMERLKGIHERHARYRVDHLVALANSAAASSSVVDPRISARLKEASDLVGIEEPVKALIKMLSLEEEHKTCKKMKIVSIFGSGGLGKTTLAKAVYDKINKNFCCWAFVSVGQNPDPMKLLQDILVDLTNSERERITSDHDKIRYITRADMKEFTADDLVIRICKFLEAKRCFIVVDDIWDENIWVEAIENVFMNSTPGSRIIATTRRSDVAKRIGQPFEIQQLSDNSSKKLLSKTIFDSEDKIDNDEVAEKFLQKCHGLPLAITTIGRLLAREQRNEWSNVYKSIFLNSNRSEPEKDPQVENMMRILSFSYYHLPCHLRTCMLYLSVFPEDEYVDKNMLIWRWIAEGLVHKDEGKELFKVGERYFRELIRSGLIQPLWGRFGSLVIGCRVHDFVLRLILKLSRAENFVCVLDSKQQRPKGRVRRLALQNISDTIKDCLPVEVIDEQKAVGRSFNAMFSNMVPAVVGFKHLRVLALENCRVAEGYLEDIGKLLHLRYLGLTGTTVGKLPEGVGNLKFLQTLMLHGTGIKELPKSLEHRTQLMCLRADETTRVPGWIGKLTSLEELDISSDANSAGRFVKELGQLTRLRVLRTGIDLQDQGQARDFLESLSKLQKIETVDVKYSPGTIKLTQEGVVDFKKKKKLRFLIFCGQLRFPRLPAWINPGALPKLYKLSLQLCKFEQQHMDTLGQFPNLRHLELKVVGKLNRPKEDVITCGDSGFQNLLSFDFNPFTSMPMIKFFPGAMPRLRRIRFFITIALDKEDRLVLDYGLGNLGLIQLAEVIIFCFDCSPAEVEAVEAAVRHQVRNIRPNNPPTLSMKRYEDTTVTTMDPDDKMSTRQLIAKHVMVSRCQRVWKRHKEQVLLFTKLISATGMVEDCTPSGLRCVMNKVHRIREECMDALETALHGQILWHAGDDDAEFLKQFSAQLEAKRVEMCRFFVRDDLPQMQYAHQMNEYIVALERGLEVLTTAEYQRLSTMWEEVQAQHSLQVQEQELKDRLVEQNKLHRRLYIDFETTELLPVDGMRLQVLRFMDQWYDTTDLAFHGCILRPNELGAEDHRDYREEILGFWERYNTKYTDLTNFEEDRDFNRVKENIAALEAALNILTSEYPRFSTMWEELQAADDGLLPAIVREEELRKRLDEQFLCYRPLISPSGLDKLLAVDANKVQRYLYQSWDRVELAMHGRILWRSELTDENHPDYMNQGMDRVFGQFSKEVKPSGQYRDVHQVIENIAVKEAMLEKLTVEYPRLAAMLEGLKAELCLPAAEDEGTDEVTSNVIEELEEQQNCLSDQ